MRSPSTWPPGTSSSKEPKRARSRSRQSTAMGRLPGVDHLDAIRALEKTGFRVVREGKHTVMSDGTRILTIPRHNPVNAFTMGGIVRDAGLTVEEFRRLL